MAETTFLTGQVGTIDGELVLFIPLAVVGSELVECSRGIGEVEGDFLKLVIRDWLAQKLGIHDGSWVRVDNANGKFNLAPHSFSR